MLNTPDLTVQRLSNRNLSYGSSHGIQTCQPTLAIMLLILLIVFKVSAEWVEISQHYVHRKPIRPHNPFVEEPTTHRYVNHSVTEYNWNHDVRRIPNIGNIKRVQLVDNNEKSSHVAANSHSQEIENYADSSKEETASPPKGFGTNPNSNEKYTSKPAVKVTNKPHVETRKVYTPKIVASDDLSKDLETSEEFTSDNKVKGTVHRVSNIGNVKRVQLANTPVKSPSLKRKPETINKSSLNDDDIRSKLKLHGDLKNRPEFETIKDITSGQDIETGTGINNEKYTDRVSNFNNFRKSDKITSDKRRVVSHRIFDNYTLISNIPTSEFITGDGSTEPTYFPTERNSLLPMVTHQNTRKHDFEIHQNPFVTKEKVLTKFENAHSNRHKINSEDITNKGDDESQSNEHDEEDTVEENAGVKVNTLENVLKFIKVVADTISTNTRRSVGGKMRYLQELKNTILATIEDRIESTWPDDKHGDAASRRRRQARSTHATARGHVEIPSSEGALMTISFLTFAVFLIKLVLQVIHTYKNKTMMVAPLVVASAGRAARRDTKRN